MESSAATSPLDRPVGRVRDTLAEPATLVGYGLPFALVVYLSLKGGGYDVIVRGEIGLLAWWAVLLAAVAGLLAGHSLPQPARIAALLLGLFATWTTLGTLWGESAERGFEEGARVWGYAGVFVLALIAQGRGGLRRTASSLAAGIALVGILALLSRLHPAWFPPNEVAEFVPATASRISYPLGYWNGVAALIALGVPLLLWLATAARSIAARAAAAAALPPLLLAVYFTLSRGGAIDLAVGAGVLLILHPRRLQLLATIVIAGLGGLLLIALSSGRDALQAGLLDDAARSQGDQMLLATIGVSIVAALAQGGLALAARRGRLRWPSVARPALALQIAAGVALVAVAVALVAGLGGWTADRFEEFKQPVDPGDTAARFESASGNGRWQYWSAAVDAFEEEPLLGIGPGSYEFFWARDPGLPGTVRDAHSLYVETLGELGPLGLILLGGAIGWILYFGLHRTLATSGSRRAVLAALVATCATFAVAAGIDWLWELAVLPIIFLLAGVALLAGDLGTNGKRGLLQNGWLIGLIATVAVLVIAIPLLSVSSLQSSRDQFNQGQLDAALDSAKTAERVQPFAGSPRLQQALVLERQGLLGKASIEAREATEREPTNWRPWFILARIEAQRGTARSDAALKAFRRAAELNPVSPLFETNPQP